MQTSKREEAAARRIEAFDPTAPRYDEWNDDLTADAQLVAGAFLNSISKAPFIDIVFDGPPGHEGGRFVEVEDAAGKSIKVGEWLQRADGLWALRIPARASTLS